MIESLEFRGVFVFLLSKCPDHYMMSLVGMQRRAGIPAPIEKSFVKSAHALLTQAKLLGFVVGSPLLS